MQDVAPRGTNNASRSGQKNLLLEQAGRRHDPRPVSANNPLGLELQELAKVSER